MGLVELFLIAVGLSMDAFAVAITLGLSMQKVTLKKCLIVGLYFGIFQGGMPLIGYLLGAQFIDYIQAFDHWIAFVLLGIIGGKMIWESLQKDEAGEAFDADGDAGLTSGEASESAATTVPPAASALASANTSAATTVSSVASAGNGASVGKGSGAQNHENRTSSPKSESLNLGPKKMLPLAIATSIDALAVGISFALMVVNIIFAVLSIALVTLILSMIAVKIGNVFGSRYKSKAELAGGIILVLIGLKILLEHLGVIAF